MTPYVNPVLLPLTMLAAWAVVAAVAVTVVLVRRVFVGRSGTALGRLAGQSRTPSSARHAA